MKTSGKLDYSSGRSASEVQPLPFLGLAIMRWLPRRDRDPEHVEGLQLGDANCPHSCMGPS